MNCALEHDPESPTVNRVPYAGILWPKIKYRRFENHSNRTLSMKSHIAGESAWMHSERNCAHTAFSDFMI